MYTPSTSKITLLKIYICKKVSNRNTHTLEQQAMNSIQWFDWQKRAYCQACVGQTRPHSNDILDTVTL